MRYNSTMAVLSFEFMQKALAEEFVFFPQMIVNEFLVKSWLSHFEQCDASDFRAALHLAVKNSSTVPSPRDVEQFRKTIVLSLKKMLNANEAWYKIYYSGVAPSPVVAVAQKLKNWDSRKKWNDTETHNAKVEFAKMYNPVLASLKKKHLENLGIKKFYDE